MPTLSGWTVAINDKTGPLYERGILVREDTVVECKIGALPNALFNISMTTHDNENGVYVVVHLDGVLHDHFLIPKGTLRFKSAGWQSSSGCTFQYAWLSPVKAELKFRSEPDMPACVESALHGIVSVSLYPPPPDASATYDSFVRRPSPARSYQPPKQTHYAHYSSVKDLADEGEGAPARQRLPASKLVQLRQAFAVFRFDYADSVLAHGSHVRRTLRRVDADRGVRTNEARDVTPGEGPSSARNVPAVKRPRSPSPVIGMVDAEDRHRDKRPQHGTASGVDSGVVDMYFMREEQEIMEANVRMNLLREMRKETQKRLDSQDCAKIVLGVDK